MAFPPKKPGVGIMIALGKPGASAPPRYKSPGSESEAATPTLKPSKPSPPDPDAGRDEQSVTISPDAVDYHDSSEACQSCEYFNGGNCRVLKMSVDPQGHCEAFEATGADTDPNAGAPDVNESDTENYPA